METSIFYFSTTGNSLLMARRIAEGLGETRLIAIPRVKDNLIDVTSDRIGIVFPVYVWGLPRIVTEFIKKLHLSSSTYVFQLQPAAVHRQKH